MNVLPLPEPPDTTVRWVPELPSNGLKRSSVPCGSEIPSGRPESCPQRLEESGRSDPVLLWAHLVVRPSLSEPSARVL